MPPAGPFKFQPAREVPEQSLAAPPPTASTLLESDAQDPVVKPQVETTKPEPKSAESIAVTPAITPAAPPPPPSAMLPPTPAGSYRKRVTNALTFDFHDPAFEEHELRSKLKLGYTQAQAKHSCIDTGLRFPKLEDEGMKHPSHGDEIRATWPPFVNFWAQKVNDENEKLIAEGKEPIHKHRDWSARAPAVVVHGKGPSHTPRGPPKPRLQPTLPAHLQPLADAQRGQPVTGIPPPQADLPPLSDAEIEARLAAGRAARAERDTATNGKPSSQ